jgi:hypothetical protein
MIGPSEIVEILAEYEDRIMTICSTQGQAVTPEMLRQASQWPPVLTPGLSGLLSDPACQPIRASKSER